MLLDEVEAHRWLICQLLHHIGDCVMDCIFGRRKEATNAANSRFSVSLTQLRVSTETDILSEKPIHIDIFCFSEFREELDFRV
jgi:hypothetical protein